MSDLFTILVLSDIHFASRPEIERGRTELHVIDNPVLRLGTFLFRYFFWMRDPAAHNHLLDQALDQAGGVDLAVANGDYSCDTAFVGMSDDAAFTSAQECLDRLREKFGDRLLLTLGDHELGKMSLFGGRGGMRLASWERARSDLDIEPFWQHPVGRYLLMGVTSSIIAYPVYEPETKSEERPLWRRIREVYLKELAEAFENLHPKQSVILFCHDPTALPFLNDLPPIRRRLGQIESTIIGHLHTPVIYRLGRLLAGMPPIDFLGNAVRRMSHALHRADSWSGFNIRFCPSLAGSQLFKDGGFLKMTLDMEGDSPVQFRFHRLKHRR